MKAIITGANKGIGKAIALKLSTEGFDLALCGRNANELAQVKAEIERINPNCKIILKAFDLKDKNEIKQFSKEIIAEWGYIDLLINNAGIFLSAKMIEEQDDVFENQFQVNVAAAYYLSKGIVPSMIKAGKGHIFNICSSASLSPKYNAGSYSVSKYALKGLSDNLREELKEHNVKVTSILPGSVFTSSWEGTDISNAQFIQPEDIAELIFNAFKLSKSACLEDIVINPITEV